MHYFFVRSGRKCLYGCAVPSPLMPGGPCMSSPCSPPVAERERNESQKSFASDHFDCFFTSDQFSYGVGENDCTIVTPALQKKKATGPRHRLYHVICATKRWIQREASSCSFWLMYLCFRSGREKYCALPYDMRLARLKELWWYGTLGSLVVPSGGPPAHHRAPLS